MLCFLTAANEFIGDFFLLEGHTTWAYTGDFLNLVFAFLVAAPHCLDEAFTVGQRFSDFVQCCAGVGAVFSVFQRLSEHDPLIYSYDSVHEQYDNVGCICFDYEISVDRIEESISRVVDVLCDLKQGRFNFEASLNYELANWIELLDKPEGLNWGLAYNNHILNTTPIQFSSDKLARFDSVEKTYIMEAAKDIFTRRNMTIMLEGKKSRIHIERLNRILDRLDQCQ